MRPVKIAPFDKAVATQAITAGSDALQRQLHQLQAELTKQGEKLYREQAEWDSSCQIS